jgi:hypothetical protein
MKPLSSERREDYRERLVGFKFPWIDDFLEDADFWRTAVKTATQYPDDECAFCSTNIALGAKHTHGCPWVLAQE